MEEQYRINAGEISLFDIWMIIRNSLTKIIVFCFVTTLITGIITYFFIPKKYQSSVIFYLDEGKQHSLAAALSTQLGGFASLLPGGSGTKAELCSEIITARQFLEKVLEAENLPSEPEDIKGLKDSIKIELRKTGVLKISVLAREPELAYRLTERIFTRYRQVIESQEKSLSSSHRKYVEEQFARSAERLAKAEEALLAFQKSKGIPVLPEEINQAIAYLAELEKARMETDIILARAKTVLQETDKLMSEEAPLIKAELTESLNPTLQQYRRNLTDLELELAKARETYTDQHPVVKGLLARKEELLRRIGEEKEFILSSEMTTPNPVYQALVRQYVEGQIQVAGEEAKKSALDKYYGEQSKKLAQLPADLLAYGRLAREQKVAEQIYIMLASQLEQARLDEAREERVAIHVLDAPVIPHKKYSPSTVLNMALIGLLSLFSSVLWVFFRNYVVEEYREEEKRRSLAI
jgi:succinoglycan biosynthesis transport protein ExoP